MLRPHNHINILAWFVLLIVPFCLQITGHISVSDYRISPDNGIWSIVTGTFLHGSYNHLIGNLTSIILGASIIYNLQRKIYLTIVIMGIIVPSALMYQLGHPTIGASGLVYTMIWYIIIRGLMSRDKYRFYTGLFILVFFGSTLTHAVPPKVAVNIFGQPMLPKVAWQSHLCGTILGFSLAVYQRLKRSK